MCLGKCFEFAVKNLTPTTPLRKKRKYQKKEANDDDDDDDDDGDYTIPAKV
jgi:hypothetical protein